MPTLRRPSFVVRDMSTMPRCASPFVVAGPCTCTAAMLADT